MFVDLGWEWETEKLSVLHALLQALKVHLETSKIVSSILKCSIIRSITKIEICIKCKRFFGGVFFSWKKR